MKIKKVAIDDNILIKNQISTAGSKSLSNFSPPFGATVVDKLLQSGISDIIQTQPNEFGIDLMQSFGSIDAVSSGNVEIGIGADIIGTIRGQASKNNIFFIKPTYGTVSRFGLVSMVPSMEQIGVSCKDISLGFEALSIISGFDEKDGTLVNSDKYDFAYLNTDAAGSVDAGISDVVNTDNLTGIRIGIPACATEFGEVKSMASELAKLGATVESFDFSLLEHVPGVTYVIAAAEMSNSISRFDGIKFGHRTENFSNLEDIYVNSRTESFTFETKFLTLIGMHVLSKEKYDEYFSKSQKIRRLIKEVSNEIFSKYDAILTPTSHVGINTASDASANTKGNDADGSLESFKNAYKDLKYLALPNLISAPAVSLNSGVQFIAKEFNESMLYKICCNINI